MRRVPTLKSLQFQNTHNLRPVVLFITKVYKYIKVSRKIY